MTTDPCAIRQAGPERAASFRDPGGRLFQLGDRILRTVHSAGVADLEAFLTSAQAQGFIEAGRVVATRRVGGAERAAILHDCRVARFLEEGAWEALLEHDRIPFPSFPYEWPAEMLFQAAELTLTLALRLPADGLGLKDATPYNVLFRGPEPVFIDVLSFERREPGDAAWLPYAQFIRTFLLPLLVHKHFGLSLDQLFLARRDGVEPEEVYRWTGPWQKWRPPFYSLVSLPTWLGRWHKPDDAALYRRRLLTDREKAAFILKSLLEGLRRTLEKLRPEKGRQSLWSGYLASNCQYSPQHFEAKRNFVEWSVRTFRPLRVLDVGCNTGFFSMCAARAGAEVVAIDSDSVVVGETWRQAHEQHLAILPLVVNITRPSPGCGWCNRESASFLDRARGAFDGVLLLAMLHHLLVTERIPLPDIRDLAAELTKDVLVIEFVAPQDPMFMRLTRGREHLHRPLDRAAFEACFQARFDLVGMEHLEGTFRWLYAFRKRR